MLAAITDELRDGLTVRGVPLPVVYGPERQGQTVLARSHVVIERTQDTVRAAPTHRKNPRLIYARGIGAVARIFVHSTIEGARRQDHERIADKVVDQILVELREIIAARRTFWRIQNGRFLDGFDLDERNLQTWPGVVYELLFEVDRGVTDVAYPSEAYAGTSADGVPAVESTMGGVGGTTTQTTLDTNDSPEGSTELPGASTRI